MEGVISVEVGGACVSVGGTGWVSVGRGDWVSVGSKGWVLVGEGSCVSVGLTGWDSIFVVV